MRYLTIFLALVLAGTASTTLGAVVFGASETGDIYLIDTDAQTATLVFSVGVEFFGATDGDILEHFFATTSLGDLYRINPIAMTFDLIGSSGGPEIKELAKNELTRTLYGTDYTSLYIMDVETGEAVYVGDLNSPGSVWAMDYDTSINQLVAVSSMDDNMYFLDMQTGQATLVGPTGFDRITDIWYDSESGQMFGAGNSPSQIFSLDTATGQATSLFSIEPSLLGLGSFGLEVIPTQNSTWGGVKSLFR